MELHAYVHHREPSRPKTIVCAADFGHLSISDDTPPFLGPELGTETQSARNYV